MDYDNNIMWIDSFEYLNDTLTDAEMDDLRRHSGTYNFSSTKFNDIFFISFSLIYDDDDTITTI